MEALETIKKNPQDFDIVITDMTMPELPGDELSFRIKKIRPDIPILLCSGFTDIMTEKTAYEKGINVFLMKPVEFKDLSHHVRTLLDNYSYNN